MNLFGTMSQMRRSSAAESETSKVKTVESNINLRFRNMEDTIACLSLKCQAMWELLKEHSKLSDQQLIEMIGQVDLRDGVQDSKITRKSQICSECGRTVGARHRQCIYCGSPIGGVEIFET